MLNHTADYALRAVLHIASVPAGRPVRVSEVATALHIPQNYLSKVLNELARRGILDSLRGPSGGFRLAVDPGSLTLERVVEPFDPLEDRCLLTHRACSGAEPCIAHRRWTDVAARIREFFRETTLADLLDHDARSDPAPPGPASDPGSPGASVRRMPTRLGGVS